MPNPNDANAADNAAAVDAAAQPFLADARVVHLTDELVKECKNQDKKFSDIIDDAGHQYIDLVMEGGGVLGIALVGYTYVLEKVGLRFLRVGGTSAGAINAMALGAFGSPATAKTERMLKVLADAPIAKFIDGDDDAKDFVDSALAGFGLTKALWKGMQIVDNLRDDLGLNPGDRFRNWLHDVFAAEGVSTTDELLKLLAKLPPGLRVRDGDLLPPAEGAGQVAVVTAEVTTETKVVFPAMAELFWGDPSKVSPADYVRASMSIPGFFFPFRVGDVPQGEDAARRWKEHYKGVLPREAIFVDGGVMSNFPIDLFHGKGVPKAPTFGVTLGSDQQHPHQIKSFLGLVAATFASARNCRDNDFIRKHPDYRKLVAKIDTGPHNWLNFNLTLDDKVDLFWRGAQAAAAFLRNFDWPAYRQLRAELAGCDHDVEPLGDAQ